MPVTSATADRRQQYTVEEMPWGRPVLVEIEEPSGSADWCRGVRSKTYLGYLGEHSNLAEGRVCVQPRRESQAAGMEAPCVPFDPERAWIRVLPGELADYS